MNGLLELVLEVHDLDRSVKFYRDMLGLTEVQRWPEPRAGVWLAMGRNAVLGLWPPTTGGPGVGIAGSRGGAHVHFAIYVEGGSLPGLKKKLESASNAVEGPIQFGPGNASIFVSDPDGNVVELADWNVDWAGHPVSA